MFTPGLHACAYETASGRRKWLSRDPIEENGGKNLYGFVESDPINEVDPLGFATWMDIQTLARILQPGAAKAGSPYAVLLPRRTSAGEGAPSLFLDYLFLGRNSARKYNDGVWRGVLAHGAVDDFVRESVIRAAQSKARCCAESTFELRGQDLLKPRQSFFSLSQPFKTLEAGFAIGSAEISVSGVTGRVKCDSSRCGWRANVTFIVTDYYSFKAFNDDWSEELPWHTPDNNRYLRMGGVHLWGTDFWIRDQRLVILEGEFPCQKQQ